MSYLFEAVIELRGCKPVTQICRKCQIKDTRLDK
jgi:hypothetical protein